MRPITSKIVKDPKDPKREVCETMVIWGKASRDMKLEYTKGSETSPPKPKVTFGVCYEEKRFMNVISVGECQQTNIAQRVKKGDYVLIAGRWSSKAYTNKNGENKTWDELRIDYIEILKDGFREAVSDAMADALASTMEQGYFKEKADFTRAFNRAFVGAFWDLCQSMQAEEEPEPAEEEAGEGTDYELSI